jgi:uncharacterized NAD(P)/FAD-binding protein YdhS
VVLALGNARKKTDGVDPWEPGALESLPDGPVYLKGTGLTAVDVALTLARLGRTQIIAVSRHGLLPQRHQPTTPLPIELPRDLGAAIREMRKHKDWRAAFDGMRPHWDELWQSLGERQQASFLRHVARYWEVHRHRMAPAVADEIEALQASGTLTVKAMGVPVKGFVDCTGPGRAVDDPLVRTLIADALVRPGPHGIGLDVTPEGRVHRAMWTIGPMRRGVLWETTAAPEIRAQARVVARELMISRVPGAVR